MSLFRPALLALAALLPAAAAQAQIGIVGAPQSASITTSANIAHAAVGAVATDSGGCPQSMAPGLPAGTAAGNLLIAVVTSRDNDPITMAGWNTLYANVALANYQAAVFWRVATGGDPTTITKTGGGCDVMIGRISRFTGVDTANPFDGGVGASYQANVPINTGSITTSVANAMLVVTAHTADNNGTNAPAGFAEAWDNNTSTGADASISLKYSLQTTDGTKGPYNMTGGNDPNHGVLFALRPASGLTINVPAGTAAGHVMVASVAARPNGILIHPPAGWTLVREDIQTTGGAGNSSRMATYYRVAGATEPASYTWTFSGASTGAAGAIITFSGVDTGNPIDDQDGALTPSSGSHAAPSIDTTEADTMLVGAWEFATSANWTAPGGMNEAIEVATVPPVVNAALSMMMATQTQGAAGATGTRTATTGVTGGNQAAGVAHLLALRPAGPVLHWTMDEPLWNGTAGEVVDATPSALNGRAVNGALTASATPAIPGNPGSCRYGAFDGTDDFVEVADPGAGSLLDITDELTVMMWLRPTAYPTAGNLKSFVSKDNNYEAHLASTGQVNWWWGGGALQLNSTTSVALNTWTHVALVYSRAGAFQRMYFNGVQDPSTNNQNGALATNDLPFQVGADQGFAGRQFPGLIDEVRVFRQALGVNRIQQYMNATRPCAIPPIDHFAISHTGSGVACDTHAITITAHDASHNPVDANALLVNLSTSNSRGTWAGIAAGGGTLNDAVAGDGAATYQFAVGSNSVTLNFRYANLAGTSETFSFGVSGGGFSETTGSASGTDDPSFTIAQAGFRFNNVTDGNATIPVQLSGKPSDTGFNAKTLRIQAINTDTATGSCTPLFASQTRSVDLGAECNSPATCSAVVPAREVSVNGAAIATSGDNGGAGAAAYTSVSLAFNASSEADTVIRYPDAGQISLHARYDLDAGVAGFEAIGGSNAFIVRPFGLAFPGISHGSSAAATLLAAAGDNFTMTVQAYQWAAGEDANNDGVPDAGVNITDNGSVPNFAATASVSSGANLPGIAPGAVSRGAACASAGSIALAGGTATAADWCYSEAGNVLLNATAGNYLAAGVDVTGTSGLDGDAGGGYAGRFKPKRFVVAGTPTLTNRTDIVACAASTFTYLNEELTLGFTLQARNTQGGLTQNYTGAYAKLDLSSAASLNLGARSGGTDLTARVDTSLVPSGSFTNGVASLSVRTGVRRASPDTPDGPFAGTQFGIAPNDGDPDLAGGVQMGTLNQDVNGDAVNDHFAVGPATELRFGRLWLQNAYGNGASVLPVPIEAQYWNGSVFAVNAADSCTTLARSAIALTFAAPLAACNLAVNAASVAFSAGVGTLVLSAPGAGAQGSVLLTPNLGSAGGNYCNPGSFVAAGSALLGYLLGRWDDAANPDADGTTAYDDKPGGRAAYGRYAQPRNFIFYRENY
jgi:MSHA biogenesis protein MshQ